MNTFLFTAWLGLLLPLPQSADSVLPAGMIPTGAILNGWSLLTGQELVPENSTLGHRPLRLLEPLSLSTGGEVLIVGLLRSEGILLKPIRRGLTHGPHWATTDPQATPPMNRYQVRVVRLEHLTPEPICKLLRSEAQKQEKEIGLFDRPSRFVADSRTGSVVISCTSPLRLQHYLKLLSAADRPPVAGTQRPVLRHWPSRRGRVADLALELEQAWNERGGIPLHIVEHSQSNSLMIRVPKHLWPTVEQLLEKLDPLPDS